MKKGWWGFWGYVLGSMESEQAAKAAYEQGLRDGEHREAIYEQPIIEQEEINEKDKETNKDDPQVVAIKWGERISSCLNFSGPLLVVDCGTHKRNIKITEDKVCPVSIEAWVLWKSENWQEDIEDDYRLTKEQKHDLCELLNKRRQRILESVKSKRICDNCEKCKIREEKYTKKLVNVFQHVKDAVKVDLGWLKLFESECQAMQDISYFDVLKGTLKYEFDLTETKKVEIRKLIDWYEIEIKKINEATTKTDKKNSKSDDCKKRNSKRNFLICILGLAISCILYIKLYLILPLNWLWYARAGTSLITFFVWPITFLIFKKHR